MDIREKLQRLQRITKVKQRITKVIVLRGGERDRPWLSKDCLVFNKQNTSLDR